jgi:AraC-like DNA-binding protein
MKFLKRKPSESLSDYIDHLWYFEISGNDLPFSQLYFPFGSFELTLHVSDAPKRMQDIGSTKIIEQPTFFYAGQFTKPFRMYFDKPCRCYGASFNPWSGNLLFGITASDFTNKMIPVNDLINVNNISDALSQCIEIDQYFKVIEDFIADRLKNKTCDQLSKYIFSEVVQKQVFEKKNSTQSDIGLSKRRIQQRFLKSTGLPLSTYSRKIRFQRAVSLLKKLGPNDNLTQIGLTAGYYDQSHFISNFKEFSGMSPTQFISQNNKLKDFLSSFAFVQSRNNSIPDFYSYEK